MFTKEEIEILGKSDEFLEAASSKLTQGEKFWMWLMPGRRKFEAREHAENLRIHGVHESWRVPVWNLW